jgi:hypothetical protein
MTKKYSDDTSGSFVNGVLDKIAHMETRNSMESVPENEIMEDPETEEELDEQ